MKSSKFLFVSALAISAMVMMSSCSSSKNAAQGGYVSAKSDSPYGTQIAAVESQKKAYEKPYTRAWGDATNFNLSRASMHAENAARAKMALAVEAAIEAAITDQGVGYDSMHSNGQEGSQVSDQGAKSNDLAQSIAKQVIKDTHQIHSDTFKQPDGQYHVFVCMEYGKGLNEIAATASRQIGQQISDTEKIKMNYEFEKYRKSIEEELAKQMQNQQR